MPLHLLPAQAERVSGILRALLPVEASVFVFGSRAHGRGLKAHSDLDLLVDSPEELPLALVAALREAFAESDLPFSVDLLQRRDAGAGFLERIEAEGLVRWPPSAPLPA